MLLECGYELAAASSDQLLAFLEDKRWYYVVMMKSRYLNLHSFDTIATDEADLGVPALLPLGLSELQSNQPLNL